MLAAIHSPAQNGKTPATLAREKRNEVCLEIIARPDHTCPVCDPEPPPAIPDAAAAAEAAPPSKDVVELIRASLRPIERSLDKILEKVNALEFRVKRLEETAKAVCNAPLDRQLTATERLAVAGAARHDPPHELATRGNVVA